MITCMHAVPFKPLRTLLFVLVAAPLLSIGGCSRLEDDPATILDIRQIAGQEAAAVEAVLGPPSLSKTTTVFFDTLELTVPAAHYRDGNVHIAYVDERAAGIFIDLADLASNGVTFEPEEVLRAVGLDDLAPSEQRPGVYMQWTDYPGFLQISAFVYPPTGGAGAISLWYGGDV